MKKGKNKYGLGGTTQNLAGLLGASGASVIDLINSITETPDDFRSVNRNSGDIFALGGMTKSNVEVEGKEMLELPNGDVLKVQGASHEAGGVDLNLPVGTGVYSDRIDIDGKSIAKRKEGRAKTIKSSDKNLNRSPFDPIRARSNDRLKKGDEVSSSMEMEVQENITKLMKNSQKGYGGKVKYQLGGVIGDLDNATEDDLRGFQTYFNQAFPNETPLAVDGILGPKTRNAFSNFGDQFNTFQSTLAGAGDDLNAAIAGLPPYEVDPLALRTPNEIDSPSFQNIPDFSPQPNDLPTIGGDSQGMDIMSLLGDTQGDQVGAVGTAISGLSPLLTTLANRIGDDPNINPFENVGDDSVQTLAEGEGRISQIFDNQRRRNDGRTQASLNSAAGSTTSMSGLRAIQQMINAQAAEQDANIAANESSQILGLLNNRANTEFRRDQTQAQGEATQDMNDRRDRDNFYTQLGLSLNNLGTATQKFGSDLNRQQLNQDQLDLLNTMSKFGFKFERDASGRFKLTR